MNNFFKTFIAALTVLSLSSGSAHAQKSDYAVCQSYEDIQEILLADFSETLSKRGKTKSGKPAELWESKKWGTWTIVLLKDDGTACFGSYGEK